MRFVYIASVVLLVSLAFSTGFSSAVTEDEFTTEKVPRISFRESLDNFGVFIGEEEIKSISDADRSAPNPDTLSSYLLGAIYFEKARIRRAMAEFEKARIADPDSTVLLFGIARGHFMMDEFDKSIEACDEILSLDPHHLDALLLKARILNLKGAWKDAEKIYKEALELKPYNIEALKAIGSIAYSQQNDFKRAREYYEKVLEVSPRDLGALIIVGTAAAMLDEFDEAQVYLDRAIQQNSEFIGPYIKLANILESMDKMDAAFKIYRQTLIANPSNKQAQLYFSLAANKLMGADKAIEAYKELADDFPYDTEIQLLYAGKLLVNGNLEEAERVLDKVLELTPGNPYALVRKGEIALRRSRLDEAESLFQKAISLESYNTRLYSTIAQLLIENKLYESAGSYLQKALQIEPERSEIFVTLLENYYKLNQLDKAEELTLNLIEKNHNNDVLYSFLGTLYRVQGKLNDAIAAFNKAIKEGNPELDVYTNLVSLYLQTDNPDKASETVEQARDVFVAERGNDFYYNIAIVYEQWGYYEEAVAFLEELLALDETYLLAYAELAHIHNLQGDKDKALDEFRRAREKLGDGAESVNFLLLEASVYAEQRKYESATEILKKALKKEPTNLAVYRELVLTYSLWDKYQEALSYINRAKEKFGIENSELLKWEAQVHSDMQDFKKVEELVNSLLQQNPEDIEAHYILAGIYYEANQYDKSIEIFKKILKIDPNHTDALNSLGYTLAVKGEDLDKAEEYIRRALNFKPYAGYIIDSLGWVFFKRGDYETALELIQTAEHRSLADAEIFQHLGEIYLKLGNTDKAEEYLREALRLDPENDDIQRMLKEVEHD